MNKLFSVDKGIRKELQMINNLMVPDKNISVDIAQTILFRIMDKRFLSKRVAFCLLLMLQPFEIDDTSPFTCCFLHNIFSASSFT